MTASSLSFDEFRRDIVGLRRLSRVLVAALLVLFMTGGTCSFGGQFAVALLQEGGVCAFLETLFGMRCGLNT